MSQNPMKEILYSIIVLSHIEYQNWYTKFRNLKNVETIAEISFKVRNINILLVDMSIWRSPWSRESHDWGFCSRLLALLEQGSFHVYSLSPWNIANWQIMGVQFILDEYAWVVWFGLGMFRLSENTIVGCHCYF